MLRIGQQEGICEVRPDVCPMNIAQVCGCDAQTYSNACIAASNGVNVMTEGACQTEAPTTISPTSTPVEPNEDKAAYCSLSSRDDDCWIEGWPQCCLVEDQPATTVRVMGGIIAHGPQIRIATTIMVGQTAVAVFKLPGKSGEHSMLTQTHSNLHDSKI